MHLQEADKFKSRVQIFVHKMFHIVTVYTFFAKAIFAPMTKGAFFSESEIRISNLPKKLFQKPILSLKFEIPALISKKVIQTSSAG